MEEWTASTDTGDIVYVTVLDPSTGKKGIGRIAITASATNTLNITVKNVEPEKAITHLLRTRVPDANTTRANAVNMIIPSESRLDNLSKTSYPRITVKKVSEESMRAGIGAVGRKRTITVRVGVHVWGKKGDYQKLTMADSVAREGPLQLAYIARQVTDVIEGRFFATPLTRDPMIKDLFETEGGLIIGSETEEFDNNDRILKHFIEVSFHSHKSVDG